MDYSVVGGWLVGVRRLPSPNFNERPEGVDPELIVIHNISLPPGEFGGEDVARLFCNCLDCSRHPYFQQLRDLQVSAHLLIDRQGQLLQFVPFHRRAWHAGVSDWRGETDVNSRSIGIELVNRGHGPDYHPFPEPQMAALEALIGDIRARWTIPLENIVGHEDVAPGRKIDPGPKFDWVRLIRQNLAARAA